MPSLAAARQEKFISLMAEGKTTQEAAYIQAGYSKRGARAHAARLASKGSIQAEILARRAAQNVVIARDTVASMAELQEGLTRDFRGEGFLDKIHRLESHVEKSIKRTEALELSIKELPPDTDKAFKAMLQARVLNTEEAQFDQLAHITKLYIEYRAEANKAAITLLKAKGAFDPKRSPVDDTVALLNATLRNVMAMRMPPSVILATLKAQGNDAVLRLRAADPSEDEGLSEGGSGRTPGIGLFVREPAAQPTR